MLDLFHSIRDLPAGLGLFTILLLTPRLIIAILMVLAMLAALLSTGQRARRASETWTTRRSVVGDAPPAPAMTRRPGRPRLCSDEVLLRVISLRRSGLTYTSICTLLNAEEIPTPAGSTRWWPSHVSRLLSTRAAAELTRSFLGEGGLHPS